MLFAIRHMTCNFMWWALTNYPASQLVDFFINALAISNGKGHGRLNFCKCCDLRSNPFLVTTYGHVLCNANQHDYLWLGFKHILIFFQEMCWGRGKNAAFVLQSSKFFYCLYYGRLIFLYCNKQVLLKQYFLMCRLAGQLHYPQVRRGSS